MPNRQVKGIPPKLLRFDVLLSHQLPTLARVQIQAEDGEYGFLAKRDTLELIANICRDAAAKLPNPRDLT